MEIFQHPFLYPILLPLASGLLCLLLPKILSRVSGWIAVIISAFTVYLVWPLFMSEPQTLDLIANFSFKVDKLSGFILLATTIFGFLISLYSLGFMKKKIYQNKYFAYLLWTIAAACGALLANELIILLSFWGFLGFTLYLMIALGGAQASSAAKKTFIIIGATDSLLILGIGLVWIITGSTRMDGLAIPLNHPHTYIAFLTFAIAAFAKAGAMPFHTWVPDCGEKAPTPVTAFLPASLDKLLGIYLLARTANDLFVMNWAMNTLLMVVGATTVLLAVMMALVQHDLKRLLSYHAVSQVGYMVLGIGTGIPIGIAGGLFHMLNHAVYKSCLFLCTGAVETKTKTTDMDKLGGLAKVMPITFICCLIASLSIAGIPPFNGFASKWMVYQGIIDAGKSSGGLWIIWLAVAMLGSALTLASFVKVLHATFLRKPSAEVKQNTIREVGLSMTIPMIILAVTCVLFGVLAYRLPLNHIILPAVKDTVAFTGIWWAGPATFLLLVGIIVGFVLYFLGNKGKVRMVSTYIGGESLPADEEVTGIDFYKTIQDINPLNALYKMAEKNFFDIYDVGTKFIFLFVEGLRHVHTGRLPWYLSWVVGGLLILLIFLRS
ncbi:NADH-quinone oxidoreductase subunit L [bacterium]|nr:NADH-quinone oxidoreductase subunit L [bacterium]